MELQENKRGITMETQQAEQTEQDEKVLRFEPKDEAKTLKALSKILSTAQNPISEETAIKSEFLGVMDCASVCMIVARTEQAKRLLSRYKEKEDNTDKMPPLDFEAKKEDLGTAIISKYNGNYLKKIIDLMIIFNESLTFRMKRDYPIMIENEHFKVILAPRCEN